MCEVYGRSELFEASHVYKFSDGDPDHTEHVVAICPHCHARIHR
ncbi:MULTISPECIES: HNH endonuclease [Exiguobacterium]